MSEVSEFMEEFDYIGRGYDYDVFYALNELPPAKRQKTKRDGKKKVDKAK